MIDPSLIKAARDGDRETIRSLVEKGVDVNATDEQGWTPLNWAAGGGDVETIQLLLEAGASITNTGRDKRSPYMIALAAGNADAARLLADKAGVNAGPAERPYCKAYYLDDLRRFRGWGDVEALWLQNKGSAEGLDHSGEEADRVREDIVFLHHDFTVTESMWHGEDIILDRVSPDWRDFCMRELGFSPPDELEIVSPTAVPAG